MTSETADRKFTRLYTGADGESHFEDAEIPLRIVRGAGLRSERSGATGIIFTTSSGKSNPNWQNPAHRQFVILTAGAIQVRVGSGEQRQFGVGDVLLAEDCTGHGHITTAVAGQPWAAVLVTID